MRDLQGIIFDCDGVLFESRRANLAYYNTVFELLGEQLVVHPDDESRARLCHTACSRDVFHDLLGPEKVQHALDCAAELDYKKFIPLMKPMPEMAEALDRLSCKYSLALATNRGASAESILHYFDLHRHFTAIVTSRDVPRPKPFPDMLHLALKRMELPVEQVLYVGDSNLDRLAASEAHILFAAYKADVPGDIDLESFSGLLEWIGTVS
ncbi:MAG TPA: HAD family hydrolase [Desulfuromonadales bacterium]|nr:HAD family hydrolase [Desulfuromonadales bacterium]